MACSLEQPPEGHLVEEPASGSEVPHAATEKARGQRGTKTLGHRPGMGVDEPQSASDCTQQENGHGAGDQAFRQESQP